jgi:V8-like Glu-specific endopeptidase
VSASELGHHDAMAHLPRLLACLSALAVGACALLDTDTDTDTERAAISGTQRSAAGYSEAVRVVVNNAEGDYCSGVAVAPRVILTAAHCIVFNPVGTAPRGTWTVTLPFAAGGAQVRTVSRSDVIDAAFRSLTRSNFSSRSDLRDLGVLLLDTPLTGVAFPTLSRSAPANNSTVAAIGRAFSGPNANLVMSSTRTLRYVVDGTYPLNYATAPVLTGGDSGGPLVLEGTHQVVGTAAITDPPRNRDYFTRLDGAVYDWIATQVAANGGWDGYTPASLRMAASKALCDRIQVGCCNNLGAGGAPFDRALCDSYLADGLENAFAQLSAPSVSQANITVDQAKANACVAALGALSCPTVGTPAAEYRSVMRDCFGALTGLVARNGSCHADVECAAGLYCQGAFNGTTWNPGGGTCQPLRTLGQSCATTDPTGSDSCASRLSGDTARVCRDGVCASASAAGGACIVAAGCGAGLVCTSAGGSAVCAATLTDSALRTYF